jgi:hypothetical protein
VPAGQAPQEGAPLPLKVPGAHGMHAAELVLPVEGLKVPEEHKVHAAAPLAEKEPAAQGACVALVEPTGQW